MQQPADGDPKSGSLKKKTKKTAKRKVHGERTSPKTRTSLSRKSQSTSVKKEKSDSANAREEMSDNRDETVKMEKVFCDICKVTILEKNYTKHMLKHSNSNGFQCDVCSRKYKHKRTMTKHKLYAHGDAPTYNCQHCDFTTIHSSYLQVHIMRKHTVNYPFPCNKCDRMFRVKADYMKHVVTHDGEPCICDVCGTKVANKISLYFHKNYNHTVKDARFQCPLCKKKLQTQKNLDSHVQQHQRKYVCDECGMELTRKTALRKHIRTHSGEKSYSCHICRKAFASATSRKVHLLTHSGVRPYVCTICGQNFTQRPALCVHWKKKHPDATEAPPSVSITNIINSITQSAVKANDV